MRNNRIKIVILGNSSSKIMTRFFEGESNNNIGSEFRNKNVLINNQNYQIEIYNTVGQGRYNYLPHGKLKDADIFVIALAPSKNKSKTLSDYFKLIEGERDKKIVAIFATKKNSLKIKNIFEQDDENPSEDGEEKNIKQKKVFTTEYSLFSSDTMKELKQAAEKYNADFFTVSTDGENVNHSFMMLIERVINERNDQQTIQNNTTVTTSSTQTLALTPGNKDCCVS